MKCACHPAGLQLDLAFFCGSEKFAVLSMNDFVAYPSRWRIALFILGSVVFVIGGLWMVGAFGSPPQSQRYSPTVILVAGWACVIGFGFCVIMWTRMLFDTRERLRIGPAGIRSAQWSDQTIPWSEITDITVWSFKKQKSIILHLHDPARFPGRGVAAMLASANRKLTAGDVSISLTGTDRSFDEAMSAIALFHK